MSLVAHGFGSSTWFSRSTLDRHSRLAPARLNRLRVNGGRVRGFTLIEVLLALGIFVVSAAMLSRLILIGSDQSQFSRDHQIALGIAESRFAQLDSGSLTIEDAGSYFAGEDQSFTWTMSVAQTERTGLYNITISVDRSAGYRQVGPPLKLVRLFLDETELAAAQSDASSSSTTGGSSQSGSGGSSGGGASP